MSYLFSIISLDSCMYKLELNSPSKTPLANTPIQQPRTQVLENGPDIYCTHMHRGIHKNWGNQISSCLPGINTEGGTLGFPPPHLKFQHWHCDTIWSSMASSSSSITMVVVGYRNNEINYWCSVYQHSHSGLYSFVKNDVPLLPQTILY